MDTFLMSRIWNKNLIDSIAFLYPPSQFCTEHARSGLPPFCPASRCGAAAAVDCLVAKQPGSCSVSRQIKRPPYGEAVLPISGAAGSVLAEGREALCPRAMRTRAELLLAADR